MKRTLLNQVSIWLMAFGILLLASCGSRSVSKTKEESTTEQKQEVSIKESAEQSSEVQQVSEEKALEIGKKATASINTEALTETQEAQKESKISEGSKKQSSLRSYHRTYYPNGQLKSEKEISRETFEEITKLKLENDYLQSAAVALREENDVLLEEQNLLKIKNDSLIQSNIKRIEANKKLLKIVESQQEKLDKYTEREAYPWYWWVIGGIIVWEVLKFFARNYLPKIRFN